MKIFEKAKGRAIARSRRHRMARRPQICAREGGIGESAIVELDGREERKRNFSAICVFVKHFLNVRERLHRLFSFF